MCNNCNSGVIQVEPGGNLPISDYEDVSHPGGVLLYGAQWIAELLVIFKSAGWDVFILFGLESEMWWQGFWHNLACLGQIKMRDWKEGRSYLWDGSEVPEQIGRTDG